MLLEENEFDQRDEIPSMASEGGGEQSTLRILNTQ